MSSRRFQLLPAAEEEANDAFDWYESEHLGLGDDFRHETKLALRRIVSGPLQFPIVHRPDIRRAVVHRFPYSIYFKVDEESILVLSIFHDKRHPDIWHGRID